MAKQTMIDTTVLVGNASGALDVSGDANSALFTSTVEENDTTSFADLVKRRIGSVKDSTFAIAAFDDSSGEPWATFEGLLSSADASFGWVESNASMAEEDFGVMVKALQSTFELGGDHGTPKMVNVSGSGDGQMIYAQVLQQDESLGATGNSTGFQFGAVTTGETLVATQWVLSVDAGTIDCTVESDAVGFAAANTHGTFAQVTTGAGSAAEQIEIAGDASGDDYWRLEYTIATGPAVVVVMIGKK